MESTDSPLHIFSISLPFNDNHSSYFVCFGYFHVKKAVRFGGLCQLARCFLFFSLAHTPLFTVLCQLENNDEYNRCKAARAIAIWSLALHGILLFITIIFFLLLLVALKSEEPNLIKPYVSLHVLWLGYFWISSIFYVVYANGRLEMFCIGAFNLISGFCEMFLFLITLKCYRFFVAKRKILIDYLKPDIEYYIVGSAIGDVDLFS